MHNKYLTILIIPLLLFACQVAPGKVEKAGLIQTMVTERGPWSGLVLEEKPDGKLMLNDLYWDSPAVKAGLQINDQLIELAGQPVHSIAETLSLLDALSPNEILKVKVIREESKIVISHGEQKTEVSADEFPTKYKKLLEKTKSQGQLTIKATKAKIALDFSLTLGNPPAPVRILDPHHVPSQPKETSPPIAWLGVRIDSFDNLAKVGGPERQKGVRITRVLENTPAQKAGLKDNDIIVAYDDRVFSDDDDSTRATLTGYIKDQEPGTVLRLRILRPDHIISAVLDGEPIVVPYEAITKQIKALQISSEIEINLTKNYKSLDIQAILGTKPLAYSIEPAEEWTNDVFHPELMNYTTPLEQTVKQIMELTDITESYDDLLKRLAEDEEWNDGFRLKEITYLRRDPFKIEPISTDLVDKIRSSINVSKCHAEDQRDEESDSKTRFFTPPAKAESVQNDGERNTPTSYPDFPRLLNEVARKLDAYRPRTHNVTIKKSGLTLEEHLTQIEGILKEATELRNQAFAGLTQSDMKFLSDNIYGFTDRYIRDFHLSKSAEISRRGKIDKKILDLMPYVNYQKLFESAQVLVALLDPDYLEALQEDLADQSNQGIIIARDTPWGKIIIGGKGRNKYDEPAAMIIDLGGDDFYANSIGASTLDQPIALIIDMAGHDIYSSYTYGCQGSGLMGIGILIDLAGDDAYTAQDWGQGTGLLGIGLLYDKQGDDIYRGKEYVQGAGFFGVGLIIDTAGNDYYGANLYAQGFAATKGCGLLLDTNGNDEYYATGKYPSGYGEDRGTFSGFSQGIGTGIRCYANSKMSRSGGLGILIDGAGQDHYEAGIFSQGGGYFFGWGILYDAGEADDTYLGTRYAQGFAAHSALGFFLDEGGDDHYASHIGVHAGLAWDLSGTVFIDKSGADIYDHAGGFPFSFGAAAHNSFTLFYDGAGNDTYNARIGQATDNTYHGGSSLAIFLDQLSSQDVHAGKLATIQIEVAKEYSISLHLNKDISDLSEEDIKAYLKDLTK